MSAIPACTTKCKKKQDNRSIPFLGFVRSTSSKHRQRLAPGRLLLIVDFAELENGSLHRLAGTDAMVFYDAEVAMVFAVFFTIIAA
jgi:hypothetical protein